MNDDFQSSRRDTRGASGSPLGGDAVAMTPPIDQVFDVLGDECRRRLCLYLAEQDATAVRVDDLVDELAGPDTDHDRLAIDLHHRHLPKLDAAGLFDYDARSRTARYWGQPTVEKWAAHVRERTDREHEQ